MLFYRFWFVGGIMRKDLMKIKDKKNKLLKKRDDIDKEIENLNLEEQRIMKEEIYTVFEKSKISFEEFLEKLSNKEKKNETHK